MFRTWGGALSAELRHLQPPSTNCGSRVGRMAGRNVIASLRSLRRVEVFSAAAPDVRRSICQNGTRTKTELRAFKNESTACKDETGWSKDEIDTAQYRLGLLDSLRVVPNTNRSHAFHGYRSAIRTGNRKFKITVSKFTDGSPKLNLPALRFGRSFELRNHRSPGISTLRNRARTSDK